MVVDCTQIRFRVMVFRSHVDCTELEFASLSDALSYCYSTRSPGFRGRLQLWDDHGLIQAWDGGGRPAYSC